jgi:hypothetical protein
MVSFPSLSMILCLILTYLHVVWRRRRDKRAALCGYSVTMTFRLKQGYYTIIVSFPSLSMILCLILTYLHVVWRRRRDERAALCGYSVTMTFCLKQGYYTIMSYLRQFSIIIYDSMLASNVFICSLEAPKRREGHVLSFFCYNKILLGNRGIIQL